MFSNIFVFSLFLLTILGSGRVIQVPYVASDETLYLRLDQLHSADQVFNIFGNLEKVY